MESLLSRHKKYIIVFLGTLIFALFYLLIYYESGNNNFIYAKNGNIKIDSSILKEKGVVNLAGEWEFYFDKLIMPNEFKENFQNSKAYIKSPGVWNGYNFNGKILNGEGFATYRLIINSLDDDKKYAIKMLDIDTAYKIWSNGELVVENGIVSNSNKNAMPSYKRQTAHITSKKGMVELVIWVSNFSHNKGGIEEAIRFGYENNIEAFRIFLISREIFLFGSVFWVFFLFLIFYFVVKKEKSFLYFCFICIVAILRILTTGQKLIYELIPNISWYIVEKLEYMAYVSIAPLFAIFIYYLYKRMMKKEALKAILYISLLFELIILFASPKIFTGLGFVFQVFSIIFGGYIYYVIALSFNKSRSGSAILLFGSTIFYLLSINDVLYYNNFFPNMTIPIGIVLGLYVFILCQSVALALKFSEAYVYIENLKNNFEKGIIERTKQLKEQQQELEVLASIDYLTKINNRRVVFEIFESHFNAFRKDNNQIFCVALLDIDHFKNVNDNYGHLAGDNTLCVIANSIKNNIGEKNICGRYGGEEFIIIFRNSNIDAAFEICEKIRKSISEINFESNKIKYNVTTSIGVSEVLTSDITLDEMLKRADDALLSAKRLGRNIVCKYEA